MTDKNKVAVLGGGSFGTVLANLAASNGHEVRLWVRDSDQALRINSEGVNTSYHPELKLSKNIFFPCIPRPINVCDNKFTIGN